MATPNAHKGLVNKAEVRKN
jgi:hypothetical protein